MVAASKASRFLSVFSASNQTHQIIPAITPPLRRWLLLRKMTNLYDEPIPDVIPNVRARVDPDIADDFGIRSATSWVGRSDLTEDPRS
jgi:hypothetical protein